MSTLTGVYGPLTMPRPDRTGHGPCAARPGLSSRHVVAARPVACRVSRDPATWELTGRGLALVMLLIGAVLASGVVTCVVAFLSVSNSAI